MTTLSTQWDKLAMNPAHVKNFLILTVLLNWPPILFQIPFFLPLSFFPYLLWINIPALWLGLAKLFGPGHYNVAEFGAMPMTAFAWILLVVFWLLVAAVLPAINAFFLRLHRKERNV